MRFLIFALYILFACLYRILPHLSFFLHFVYLSSAILYVKTAEMIIDIVIVLFVFSCLGMLASVVLS